MPILALLLTAWSLLADDANARPDDYRVNVREACRQEVAGAYLRTYDERERSADYLRALARHGNETKQALAQARKNAEAAKAASLSQGFDLTAQGQADDAQSIVQNLAGQLAEIEKLQRSTEATLNKASTREKILKASISKVFVFERTGDKPDGGYPFRIDYRDGCPKYRALCPLPTAAAAALANLEIDGFVPEACARYAGLSGIAKMKGKAAAPKD